MNKQIASVIAIALFLLVGCATSGPKLLDSATSGPKLLDSAEDIAGSWQSTISSRIQFKEDGTIRRQSFGGTVVVDEFRFEGTRLLFLGAGCNEIEVEKTGVYEVELLENGNLKFTVIEDECLTRVSAIAGDVIEVEWEPVP